MGSLESTEAGMDGKDIYDQGRVERGITAMHEAAHRVGLNLLETKAAAEAIANAAKAQLNARGVDG